MMKKNNDVETAHKTLIGAADLADHIKQYFIDHDDMQERFFTIFGYATAMMLNKMSELEGINLQKLSKDYREFLGNVINHVKEIYAVVEDPNNLPN